MTQPVIPPEAAAPVAEAPSFAPTSHIAPFTEAALKAALPKPKAAPAPVASEPPAPEAVAPAAEAAAPEAPSKLALAEAASARVVARRREAQQQQQRIRELEAQNRQAAERAQMLERQAQMDPIEALRARGVDPAKALMQAAVDQSSPEWQLQQIAKQNEELRKRLDEREQREAQQRQQADMGRREQIFIEGAKKHKALAELAERAPMVFIAEARSVIEHAVRTQGRVPVNDDIYEFLNWVHTGGAEQASAPQAPPAPAPVAPPAEAKAPALQGVRTMSSKALAPAAGGPKPYGKMTKEERAAYDAARLRELTASRSK